MHIRSADLRRCLGDEEMDIRTVRRRLEELGFTGDIVYIETSELIERVSQMNRKKMVLSHQSYKPKSDFAKKL